MRARYEFRSWCGCSAPLFAALHGRRQFNRRKLVGPRTELCIEGFPRSANSYTVVNLVAAQRRRVNFAHHLHAPAQIQRAARWNVPTLLLLRDPRDATTSLLIRYPELSPAQVLRAYSVFHRAVLPFADHFVLAPFDRVIRDLPGVVGQLNDRFGTEFRQPDTTVMSRSRCFRKLDRINQSNGHARGEHAVSRPSHHRKARKEELLRRITSGRLAPLLLRAEAAYERMNGLAPDVEIRSPALG